MKEQQELISSYSHAFKLLQAYDEGLLAVPQGETGGCMPDMDHVRAGIALLKTTLIVRGEASPLFGVERGDALEALWGNLDQTVFGEPAYPTIEGKAAHLLYFVVKNHPLTDGNKRTAAFLFMDFLRLNNRLYYQGLPVLSPAGLAALTLLVAESLPENKELMIRLVMNMLVLI